MAGWEILHFLSCHLKNDLKNGAVFPLAIGGDAGDVPRSLKFSPTLTAVSDHEGEMEKWFPAKH